MLSGYYRKGCPDVAEIWSSKKLDPAGGGIDDIRRLLWWRCARASARFFFACGLPAPCPAPPSEICRQGCGQAGRWSFFLSSNRPLAVHNGRGSFIFLLLDYTRSCHYDKGVATAQPVASLPPLVNLPGSGFRANQQKKHCQAREAGSSLVLYFTDWEAVLHGTDTARLVQYFRSSAADYG